MNRLPGRYSGALRRPRSGPPELDLTVAGRGVTAHSSRRTGEIGGEVDGGEVDGGEVDGGIDDERTVTVWCGTYDRQGVYVLGVIGSDLATSRPFGWLGDPDGAARRLTRLLARHSTHEGTVR